MLRLDNTTGVDKRHTARNCGESGLTLVEVLAALAIVAIVSVLLFYPFTSALSYLSKGRARSEAQQTARRTMDTMARELAEAMEVYILPNDPSICAFVPPQGDVYPLRPSDYVVRYWQVWRSDPNAAANSPSPVDGSWYDKFSPNPQQNEAGPDDTDSQYVARTIFDRSDPADPLYPEGLNDPDALNRAVPAASAAAPPDNIIADRQNFVAISPNSPVYSVPELRFDPTRQVNEALVRDSSDAYVFRSLYPLWERSWTVTIYDLAGTVLTTFNRSSDPGYVEATGARRGLVDLSVDVRNEARTTSGGLITPVNDPNLWVPNSERVVVGANAEVFTRSTGTPSGSQYYIDYTNGQLAFDPIYVPDGTSVWVSYQWSNYTPTNVVVTATYATRALINISLTVSKRDSRDGSPQDTHLEQRVELKNIPR